MKPSELKILTTGRHVILMASFYRRELVSEAEHRSTLKIYFA